MNETHYQVIYKGKILEGFEQQAVHRNVAGILNISQETAARIINGKRFVLNKGLDEATARNLCIRLKQAGIRVALGVPQNRLDTAGKATLQAPVEAKALITDRPAKSDPRDEPQASAPAKPALNAAGPGPSPKTAPARIPFEFHGSGSEYFRIWIVNILLSILTLGIYSAWAKVRNKQYLYGNTRLQGAGFEYLASPVKILKGRLIVGGGIIIAAVASHFFPLLHFLLVLAMVFLAPWVITRSLAFNAHNSAWRNIRFGFNAGYGQALKTYVLWPVLAMATLGILSPYVFYRQKKFLVENSSYGHTRFTFSASSRDYYRVFMLISIPVILGFILVATAAIFLGPLMLLVLPIYLYGFSLFCVKTGNLFYNSSRLGPHRLEACMQVKDYMVLVLTNTLATALTFGLFHPWAKVRTLRYKMQHLTLIPSGDLNAFLAGKQKEIGSIGDASGDFFDFDMGL
jgi:uncharacterized membrane protein YjgN (DUF898 family)